MREFFAFFFVSFVSPFPRAFVPAQRRLVKKVTAPVGRGPFLLGMNTLGAFSSWPRACTEWIKNWN